MQYARSGNHQTNVDAQKQNSAGVQYSGQLRQVPACGGHTRCYNEFNHGTNYVVPNTVHARAIRAVLALYARYLRYEIPLVGFARDVICGHIQPLWPAQKLFSVFVEVSGYQNGLTFT